MQRALLYCLALILVCCCCLLFPARSALASPAPPPTGDWTIEVGEDVTLDGQDITFPGRVYVYGRLTVTNSTLRFHAVGWDGDGLAAAGSGVVECSDTLLTSTGEGVAFAAAWGTSHSTFTRCQFDAVCGYFDNQSINVLSDCTFSNSTWTYFRADSHNTITGTTFNTYACFLENSVNDLTDCHLQWQTAGGGWATGSSQNTFTGCTLSGFECHAPSQNTFTDCDISENLADNRFGQIGITAEGVTALSVHDLATGLQASTVIASSTDACRVEFHNTPVGHFAFSAHGAAALSFDNCDLESVWCHDYSQTTIADSQVKELQIITTTGSPHFDGQGGAGCPYEGTTVNVQTHDYHDGVPQTAEVTSDNTTFHVALDNTVVANTWFRLGDNGGPSGSHNLFEESTFHQLASVDNAETVIRNVQTWAFTGGETAQLLAENCTLTGLELGGESTVATVRDSTLSSGLVLWSSGPSLVWDSAAFGPLGDPRIIVRSDVVGAHISGSVIIHPNRWVWIWTPGSTIVRSYPVFVGDAAQNPIALAPVRLADRYGTVLWSGETDGTGYAYPEITFDETNYIAEFRVKAWVYGGVDIASLSFLSSTPITLCPGAHPLSITSFEEESYPWSAFSSGSGTAVTWWQLGNTLVPRLGVLAPEAHSGDYAMLCDTVGEGLTGLRLDLPVTSTAPAQVSLRTWTYLLDRSGDSGASSFVGFQLAGSPLDPAAGWTGALGYEVSSATAGLLQLGGASVAAPGLSSGQWHLVEVTYDRAGHLFRLRLDGELVADQAVSDALAAPVCAVLGAWSQSGSEHQTTLFDDAEVVLGVLSAVLPEHPYSSLGGPERIVAGVPSSYVLRYGNGYPVIGGAPWPGEQGSVAMTLRLTLPAGMDLVSATPAPDSTAPGEATWNVTRPYLGGESYILFEASVPSGTPVGNLGSLAVYRDGATSPDDVLPQRVLALSDLKPDLWVRKEGPAAACPGDTVNYCVTVGNGGFRPATRITITDVAPPELGGGTRILANLSSLAPGHIWRGAVSLVLSPTTPSGTVVANLAHVIGHEAELSLLNNSSESRLTVQPTPDPNQVTVASGPPPGSHRVGARSIGGVERGDVLYYTIACRNDTGGAVEGAYATMALDPRLDDNTLALPAGLIYDSATRTLLWTIGHLAAGQSASITFSVQVPVTARRARAITAQATIYFPSVPLECPTNVTVSVINGSFPDIAWNHWALLPIEQARDYGVVGGYPDGNYYPTVTVTRDQMAVYIARTLAGGDALVPDPPATPTFPDVAVGTWAYKYVAYAVVHHIVGGYPDEWYHPEFLVDRGQMAVFIARALCGSDGAVPTPSGPPTFPDVTDTSPAAWCRKHVEYIVGKGVVGGYPDGYYHPEITVTRDQMAVFISRAFALPG